MSAESRRATLPAGLSPALGASLREPLAARLGSPWFAEALFDGLPDVDFFVKDAAARYVAVSDGMVRRAGARTKDELLGRTTLEVFPAPLGQAYYEQRRSPTWPTSAGTATTARSAGCSRPPWT